MSCALKCGLERCREPLHEELGDMLLSAGFSKFVEVETPRMDIWMRGQNALAVEEQGLLVAIAPKDGHVDIYLGLGTTITSEHAVRLKDRLGAHLVQFL